MKNLRQLILIFVCVVLTGNTVLAQGGKIYGYVNTDDGTAVSFVNIVLKNKTIGTATNLKGYYEIDRLRPGKYIVRLQAIGYKPQEKTVQLKRGQSIKVDFIVEEDFIGLEQVVVSASRNGTKREEAPVIVNALTANQLEIGSSATLADGLGFAPGIRTETSCQNCGVSQVRLNGLEGKYTQVLINSRPIFSSLAAVYGLELIPENMIEQVEIVRGGGSALFGGNAIGGTINIITREPEKNKLSLSSNYGYTGVGINNSGMPASDRNIKFNASAVCKRDSRIGMNVFALKRDRDLFDANNDGFTELVSLENQSAGFQAFYRPGDMSRVTLDFYSINEHRIGGGKDFNRMAHEMEVAEQVEHHITGAGLAFDTYTNPDKGNKLSLFSSLQHIDRDSYYGAGINDNSGYGKTKDISFGSGVKYSMHIDDMLIAPAFLTMGIENFSTQLDDNKLGYYDFSVEEMMPTTNVINQLSNTIGGFVQNEWKLERMKILLGLRFDSYDIIDKKNDNNKTSGNVFVPRTNILYDLTQAIQLRGGYAAGYRAPQVFDEDLHIETSQARQVFHVNAPNLKQENSHSFTGSVAYHEIWGKTQVEFLSEGFYTILQNPFTNRFGMPDSAGNVIYTRVNATSGAEVYGVNLEAKIAPSENYNLQAGFTLQRSLYQEVQEFDEKRFLRSPSAYGFFVGRWKPAKLFTVALNGQYTGTMLVPHFGPEVPDPNENQQVYQEIAEAIARGDVIQGEKLIETGRFMDIGFKFTYDHLLHEGILMSFSAGVNNIFNAWQKDFDTGKYRDPGYVYGPRMPRTVYVGIKMANKYGR